MEKYHPSLDRLRRQHMVAATISTVAIAGVVAWIRRHSGHDDERMRQAYDDIVKVVAKEGHISLDSPDEVEDGYKTDAESFHDTVTKLEGRLAGYDLPPALTNYLVASYFGRNAFRESVHIPGKKVDADMYEISERVSYDELKDHVRDRLTDMEAEGAYSAHLATLNLAPFADTNYVDAINTHSAIRQVIRDMGGTSIPDKDGSPRYKVRNTSAIMDAETKPHDDGRDELAVVATIKRNVGMIGDDTRIIERTSFVVRFDAGSTFHDRRNMVKKAAESDPKDWQRMMHLALGVDAEELSAIVDESLKSSGNTANSSIVCISRTVYAFNKARYHASHPYISTDTIES